MESGPICAFHKLLLTFDVQRYRPFSNCRSTSTLSDALLRCHYYINEDIGSMLDSETRLN